MHGWLWSWGETDDLRPRLLPDCDRWSVTASGFATRGRCPEKDPWVGWWEEVTRTVPGSEKGRWRSRRYTPFGTREGWRSTMCAILREKGGAAEGTRRWCSDTAPTGIYRRTLIVPVPDPQSGQSVARWGKSTVSLGNYLSARVPCRTVRSMGAVRRDCLMDGWEGMNHLGKFG
jgi:hypothetical protein